MTRPKTPPYYTGDRSGQEWNKYISQHLAAAPRTIYSAKPSILSALKPAFIAEVTGDGSANYTETNAFETRLPEGLWADEGDIVWTRVWGSFASSGVGYGGSTQLVKIELYLNGVIQAGYGFSQSNSTPGVVGFHVDMGIFRGATNDSVGGNLATVLYNVTLNEEAPHGVISARGPTTLILRDGLNWGGIPVLKLTASARYDANLNLFTARVVHDPSPVS